MAWGRPDVVDVRAMLDLCAVGIGDDTPPHVYLADLRGLEFIDPGTFGLMLDYVRGNAAKLRRVVKKLVQLRPEGVVGAIVSGFSKVAPFPGPEQVCSEVDEAIFHLGLPRDEARSVLAELSDLRGAALLAHEPVARLRQVLEDEGSWSLEQSAKRLGLSTRALQRALKESGTSYRAELRGARVRRAAELLRDPERKITWIAVELGFSSLQHFVTAFRAATGETPTAWRLREDAEARARAVPGYAPLHHDDTQRP